jgi:hypothetical protein
MSMWRDIIETVSGAMTQQADPQALLLAEQQRINAILETQLLQAQERLTEIEVELESEGWQRLDEATAREISRGGLQRMVRSARLMYIANPLIRKGINDQANYVFGQGYTLVAKNRTVNTVIQRMWDDRDNQAELTSLTAAHANDITLTHDGNYLLAMMGTPKGRLKLRSLPLDEVTDVFMNPEDRRDPWFYKREWTPVTIDPATGRQGEAKPEVRWYADWQYRPDAGLPATFLGDPVDQDWRIHHVRTGKDGRFGIPDCYAALAWARAAQQDLQASATIHQALARFVYTLKVPAGAAGTVEEARSKFEGAIGPNPLGGPGGAPPAVGATFVSGPNTSLAAMPQRNVAPDPEEGRRFWLMTAAGLGVPETFFGDADVGNVATAKTLDRPTELKFLMRQQLWKEVFENIANYQVELDALSVGGLLSGVVEEDESGERTVIIYDPADPSGEPVDRKIDVVFPSLLERDPGERVRAVVAAATLEGKVPAGTMTPTMMARLLLDALAVDDVDEELKTLFPPPEDAAPEPEEAREARIITAMHELRGTLLQLVETGA